MSASTSGKLVIFSAPSGSGKSTLVHYLMETVEGFGFSISATSRAPRGKEQHGVDYFFLSTEEFRQKVDAGDFLEWEEVYAGTYYGTLNREVDKSWSQGQAVAFDIDVVGGLNLKKQFGDRALALFIQAPSIEELERRLVARGTDSPKNRSAHRKGRLGNGPARRLRPHHHQRRPRPRQSRGQSPVGSIFIRIR